MTKVRLGPDGIHIFNRNTGTNVLLDEVIPPISSWTLSPRQVSIALSNSCELECTHCYASKKPAKLNFELLKLWLLELDSADCFGVGFGGGEPTLYPKIEELCHFGKTHTRLAITMTTHGHRLNETLIDGLKSSLNFLRISMDGVYDRYEKIRGRSFSTLLNKLSLLKGRIPFGINFVVNETTIQDLTCAAKFAEEYQAFELLLIPEEGNGKGKAIDQQTLKQLSNWIDSYKGNVQLSISKAHQKLVQNQLPLPKEKDEIAFVHIDANGILKSCSFDKSGEMIDDRGIIYAFNNLISKGNQNEIVE